MVKARCLLAFTYDSLMGNGMNRILSITPHVELTTFNLESEAGLVEEIKKSLPHVVVLEASYVHQDQGLVSRLLAQSEDLRVIVVSLEDNSLQVYDHQTLRVRRFSDFLLAIYSSKTGPLAD